MSNLNNLLIKEKELELNRELVNGLPFWRIVRVYVRNKYLKIKTIQIKEPKIPFKSIFISFIEVIKLVLSRAHYDDIVLAFPRLYKINEKFCDKITDPLVLMTNIKDNCIVLQLRGKEPRANKDRIVNIDFFDAFSRVAVYFILPFIYINYRKVVSKTIEKVNQIILLKRRDKFYFYSELSLFLIRYYFFKHLLKKTHTKRIFFAGRRIFNPMVVACKGLGVKSYELQHGVTFGETITYSGEYDECFDPDFFLTFGEIWKGDQFGIPISKIINIGWAYRLYINENIPNVEKFPSTVLVISGSQISQKIINTTTELAKTYTNFFFHIRLHPCEKFTGEQIRLINTFENIKIVDNTEDSSIAVLYYDAVIGYNSTVLYEALSMGIKVGRLNYNGLKIMQESKDFKGFFNLNCLEDFKKFMESDNKQHEQHLYYSDFNPSIVNNLFK